MCAAECSEEQAFRESAECITGPISKIISTKGMPAVYEGLDAEGKETFKKVPLSSPHRNTCFHEAALPHTLPTFG